MKRICKNFNIVFFFAIFFVGCANKAKLYYYDNSQFQEEHKNSQICHGLAEAVRNNFFYNSRDSIYIENYGLYMHLLIDEYAECIRELSKEEMISLFGIPHYQTEDVAYYIISKLNRGGSNLLTSASFSTSGFVAQSILHRNELKIPTLWIDQSNYKYSGYNKLQFKENSLYGIDELDECSVRKQLMRKQVFFDKKRNIYIINSFFSFLISRVDKQPFLACGESFTNQEIDEIFGSPTKVVADTLYFATWDEPFKNISGERPQWKGKVFCVVFRKNDKGYFSLDLDFANFDMLFN